MSEQLKMPPAACPNDGACLTILPRLEEGDRRMNNHDAALNRIGTDLDAVKKDVHSINITLRERENIISFLRTIFLSLLGVGLVQVCATIWWASQLNSTVQRNTQVISDHEMRIRQEERDSASHPSIRP
jgi:hypothetical protein